MSSRRASIACGLLVFALASAGVGCGDDDDAGPPQIQPHQNPVVFGNFAVDAPLQEFQVILRNVGGGTLDITEMAVNGDVNCALDPAPIFSEPLPIHLIEGEETFLAISYQPGGPDHMDEAGVKDQISIPITSNSNTFPLMEISVCGCILDHVPTESDPLCTCNLEEVPPGNCGG